MSSGKLNQDFWNVSEKVTVANNYLIDNKHFGGADAHAVICK